MKLPIILGALALSAAGAGAYVYSTSCCTEEAASAPDSCCAAPVETSCCGPVAPTMTAPTSEAPAQPAALKDS